MSTNGSEIKFAVKKAAPINVTETTSAKFLEILPAAIGRLFLNG